MDSFISTPTSTAPANAPSLVENVRSMPSSPACWRWNFALAGSYSRCGRSALKNRVPRLIGMSLPIVPNPPSTLSTISWRLIPYFTARRTLLSVKGGVSVRMSVV